MMVTIILYRVVRAKQGNNNKNSNNINTIVEFKQSSQVVAATTAHGSYFPPKKGELQRNFNTSTMKITQNTMLRIL